MAKLEYFLVAQGASVDQRTNNVTLFNVLDEMRVRTFPATYPELVAVSSWNAEAGDTERDFQVAVRVSGAANDAIEFKRNLRIPGRRARVLLFFQGVPIKAPGQLLFELQLDGQYKASHLIDVAQAELEQP
jgi:hypothetical protein